MSGNGTYGRTAGLAELRAVLADPSLSLAAKGVLALVLTRPPGAVITRATLFESNRDPMKVIDAAIKELAQGGFVATVAPAKRSAPRRSGGITLRQPPPPEGEVVPRGQVFGARERELPQAGGTWVPIYQAQAAIPGGPRPKGGDAGGS